MKQRQSNFELMRIVSMLLIIVYHCVLHTETRSGDILLLAPFRTNQVFCYLFGMWGLAGVGCFFLLTAYFMIPNGRPRTKKLFLIILQTIFWAFVTEIVVFRLLEHRPYTVWTAANALISPFWGNYWYITAYLGLILLSPFLNRIIEKLDDSTYRKLLIVFTVVSPIYSTIGDTRQTLCDLTIGIYYYLLWGYLRKHPDNWFERNRVKIFVSVFLFCVCAACCSSYVFTKLGDYPPGIISICCRASFLQVLLAVSLFYIFKHMDIGSVPWINFTAQGVLGVYLIHEDEWMYPVLWTKVFGLQDLFLYSKWFPLYLIGLVLLVYVAATVLDLARLYLLERPLSRHMGPLDRLFRKADAWLSGEGQEQN